MYLHFSVTIISLLSRYYDPVTHRFVNADGYFQAGGGLLDTNMNAYCGNNPINFSDPTGQFPSSLDMLRINVEQGRFIYSASQILEQQKQEYLIATGKHHKGPRKDSRKGSEDRQPSGNREKNVGHPNGEEHSRVPKGTRGPRKIDILDILGFKNSLVVLIFGTDSPQFPQVQGIPNTGDQPIHEKMWDDIMRVFG